MQINCIGIVLVLVLPILFKSIANNPVHLYNKLYLLVSAVDPQGSGVKCCYVTARCHHSYRKNYSPHSVECDIVMTDTSSSQQGGWEALHPPAKMLGVCIPITPPLTPLRMSLAVQTSSPLYINIHWTNHPTSLGFVWERIWIRCGNRISGVIIMFHG